jgi:hypothetical protein
MSVIQAGNTTSTSLIYTGDTTGNLVFTTGGANTAALTLTNAQAVGIGTSTPGSTLEVVGFADVTTSAAGGYGLRVRMPTGSATPAIIQFTNNPVTSQLATISSSAASVLNFNDGSGITRASMLSGGQFVHPYNTGFLADRNAGDVSAVATIVFNHTSWNLGSAYNTSTGIFTAPVTGVYFFYSAALITGASAEIRILINGSFVCGGRNSGSAYAETCYTSLVYPLSAGDQAIVQVASGTVYGGGAFTEFQGYLLG